MQLCVLALRDAHPLAPRITSRLKFTMALTSKWDRQNKQVRAES